jgi:AcrR family transcriptional regulator
MATTQSRGPYAKTKRVRQSILVIAAEVFGQTGYRATTMKEIATRAGISESGLAHHFPNKDELLAAVLEARESRASEAIPREAGEAALRAMIEIVVEDRAHPGIVELHTTIASEAISPEHPAHEHYLRRYESVRRFTTNAFEALAQEGRLNSPLTPAELGAAYVALMDGLQLQWLYDRGALDPAEVLVKFLGSVVRSPSSDAHATTA